MSKPKPSAGGLNAARAMCRFIFPNKDVDDPTLVLAIRNVALEIDQHTRVDVNKLAEAARALLDLIEGPAEEYESPFVDAVNKLHDTLEQLEESEKVTP